MEPMAYIASASKEFPTEDEIKLLVWSRAGSGDTELAPKEKRIQEEAEWLFGFMPGDMSVWELVLEMLDEAFVMHFVAGGSLSDDEEESIDEEEGEDEQVGNASRLVPFFGQLDNLHFISRWNKYVSYVLQELENLEDEGANALPLRFRSRFRYYLACKSSLHHFVPFPTASFLGEIIKLVQANAFAMIEVSIYLIRKNICVLHIGC